MIHEFLPSNPRRPVNWRWERARDIAEGGVPLSRKYDDVWVRKALQFRLADREATLELDRLYLVDRMPDVFWAYELAFNGDADRGNSMRSEIEARILSRESVNDIAYRCATSPEVITAYEKLFFNVLDRIDRLAYITHQVFTAAAFQSIHERDYDLLWKMFGYFGGPHVLDVLITTFQSVPHPTRSDEVTGFIQDTAMNALRRKALIACQTLGVNSFTATEIIAQFIKLHEIDRAAGGGGGQQSISANVEAMVAALGPTFAIGRHAVSGVDSPMLAHYDSQGTELTGAEMIEVTTTGEIDAAKRDMVERLHFPPPPIKDAFSKDTG